LRLRFSFFFSTSDNCGFYVEQGNLLNSLFHPWLTAKQWKVLPVRSFLHLRRTISCSRSVTLFFNLSFFFFKSGRLGIKNYRLLDSLLQITLMASSYWAFSQFDLKKIIALSTTSQLRFIVFNDFYGFTLN